MKEGARQHILRFWIAACLFCALPQAQSSGIVFLDDTHVRPMGTIDPSDARASVFAWSDELASLGFAEGVWTLTSRARKRLGGPLFSLGAGRLKATIPRLPDRGGPTASVWTWTAWVRTRTGSLLVLRRALPFVPRSQPLDEVVSTRNANLDGDFSDKSPLGIRPVANFSATPTRGTAPLLVAFEDHSQGAITSWTWSFGNGASSNLQNPTLTFRDPGVYPVSLTATGPEGTSTLVLPDLVTVDEAPPVANFGATPTNGTAPLAVDFSDSSTGTTTAWHWRFGNGATSTQQDPSTTYLAPGTYSVTLTATGPGGFDTATQTALITVDEPPPVADFSATPTNGPAPLAVDFTDSSTGTVTAWSWSFGDGATSTQQNPSTTYLTPGTYSVTMTATGPGGFDTATQTDLITVDEPPPVASFGATPANGPAPLAVDFTDSSTGTVTAWSWSFGDGSTSTQQNPSTTYLTPGTYSVTLTATGPGGFDTTTQTDLITVDEPPPVASFGATPTEGVFPLLVEFGDASSGAVSGWSWEFGDGGTSSLQNPTHVYALAGSFSVTLTVTGPSGMDTRVETGFIGAQVPAFRYGMNSSANGWAARTIPFADALARGLEFGTLVGSVPTFTFAPLIPLGQEPPLLGQGWPDFSQMAPGEKPMSRLFIDMNGSAPDGSTVPYVVTWEGTGSCSLIGPMVVSEANRSSNRVEVFVDPQGGGGDGQLVWVMDSSDPLDPVRDAHVWLPGMETTRPIFWPPFVEKVQAMNGGTGPHVWRTLNWNQIRHYGALGQPASFVFDLAGRITPASPSQGTRRGVCPEFQVALCNLVGANLHFIVPHQTDQLSVADYETFVRDALTVIRDGSPAVPGVNAGQPFSGLDPGLTLTLELSNEMWNNSFVVHSWLVDRAMTNGLSLEEQIAIELERVFDIADEVFAGPDSGRLRKFVGGWIGDPTFLADILSALPAGTQVDAVGPAAYFRPRSEDIDAWLAGSVGQDCPNCPTPEEVILSARSFLPDLLVPLLDHRLIADAYLNPDGSHPALELYEAGQSFVAGFQPWGAAANQAQVLPDMFDAYVLDFVPLLAAAGVEVVNWYSFMTSNTAQGGSNGPFGHWDNINQTLTLPVVSPYLDEGVPKAAAVYKGPPAD